MKSRRLAGAAILVTLALIAPGCSRALAPFVPNQRPSVEVTEAPLRSEGSQSVSYHFRWSSSDRDGFVGAFEYAIDPPTALQAAAGRETAWVSTRAREFNYELSERSGDTDKRAARHFHTFVVRAVDLRADPLTRYSEPRSWSFDAATVAPIVQILSPQPSPLLQPILIQPFDIRWQGLDPDEPVSQRPAGYKFKLFGPADAQLIATFLADPDSLRRYYEPSGYAGWDSVGSVREMTGIDGQQPSAQHLFVVVAFDATGAHSQQFGLSTNMLQFRTAADGGHAPTLHLSWGFGSRVLEPPAYYPDTFGPPRIDVPAGLPIRFDWRAVPVQGTTIKGYRWVLDPVDISDETRRDDEETDWNRWSMAGIRATTAIIGPFAPGTTHFLHVEVTDNGGRRASGVQVFRAFDVPLNDDLLIVDDTRLAPDQLAATSDPAGNRCLRSYPSSLAWPAAAELDTFLYAVGGRPWRAIPANCPAPTGPTVLSTPGLFAAYRFDTLGTRQGFENYDQSAPLATLARYRHVIWMTDLAGAQASSVLDPIRPMTALRHMSQNDRVNTLQQYIALGGRVWLVGAGGPLANLIDHNRTVNDVGLGMVFSGIPAFNELVPGRMIPDAFHWKSELIVSRTTAAIRRSESVTSLGGSSARSRRAGIGGAPDYSRLPLELRRRSPATDPIPPTRSASSGSAFYFANIDVAYLTQPNSVIEDIDPDPTVVTEQSTLDTLYALDGSNGALHPVGATFPRPLMTYYRGPSHSSTLLGGFALWDLTRADAASLVEFVLEDLWGLSRTGLGSGVPRQPRVAAASPLLTPAQAASRSRLPLTRGGSR